MANPFINIGEKMKVWLGKIIRKDFGDVSFAKGLYNILVLYNKYVPTSAKRNMNGGVRKPYKKRWI